MSWTTTGPPIFEGEDERELKTAYALFCVQHPDLHHDAGYHVFPGPQNAGRALQAYHAWRHDPFVRAEIERLRGTGAAVTLPSKEEFAAEMWSRSKTADDKDAVKFAEVAGKVLGYIQTGSSVTVDNRTINVLKVPSRVSTVEEKADFAIRFKAQQTRLVADARSSRTA